MTTINILTSNNKVWESARVYSELSLAVQSCSPFNINLLHEGPDLASIGLYDYLEKSATNLKDIIIYTSNALEKHKEIQINYQPPIHLLQNSKLYTIDIFKKTNLKHFGMFIGRSNGPRLHLAAWIHQHYRDKLLLSYHFNFVDEFHTHNIGLEELIIEYGVKDVSQESSFIFQCPIHLENQSMVYNDKTIKFNYAQQLFETDQAYFSQTYHNFFVEIVCESFFSGRTFFPTEKIFRPILLKTPFIVQGPQYFLQNLKKLGFRTFDKWWDEGYSEDPVGHQLIEIKKLIESVSKKTNKELQTINAEMQPILQHNYNTALSLTKVDFERLFNEAD